MTQERHLKYVHIMWNFAPSKVHQHNSLHMVATHLCYYTNIEMAVMLPEIVQLFADTPKKKYQCRTTLTEQTSRPKLLGKIHYYAEFS